MEGTFSALPPDTLGDALRPIASTAVVLDWAVCIQSGPLRHDRSEDLERFVHRSANDINAMTWLERGFLPQFSDCLVLDEWSYYVGFDSYRVAELKLAQFLSNNLSPRRLLFSAISRFDLIYLFRVDEGWWEAYASNGQILRQLREGWNGSGIQSGRWDDGKIPVNPGGPAT